MMCLSLEQLLTITPFHNKFKNSYDTLIYGKERMKMFKTEKQWRRLLKIRILLYKSVKNVYVDMNFLKNCT